MKYSYSDLRCLNGMHLKKLSVGLLIFVITILKAICLKTTLGMPVIHFSLIQTVSINLSFLSLSLFAINFGEGHHSGEIMAYLIPIYPVV